MHRNLNKYNLQPKYLHEELTINLLFTISDKKIKYTLTSNFRPYPFSPSVYEKHDGHYCTNTKIKLTAIPPYKPGKDRHWSLMDFVYLS